MIEIKGKLISLEVIENQFVCNLKACQGASCIEGEAGAPLEGAELKEIALNLQSIKEHLDEEGKSIIENKIADISSPEKWATPLKSDGACAYSTRDETCLTALNSQTIGLIYEGTRDLYFVNIPVKDVVKVK